MVNSVEMYDAQLTRSNQAAFCWSPWRICVTNLNPWICMRMLLIKPVTTLLHIRLLLRQHQFHICTSKEQSLFTSCPSRWSGLDWIQCPFSLYYKPHYHSLHMCTDTHIRTCLTGVVDINEKNDGGWESWGGKWTEGIDERIMNKGIKNRKQLTFSLSVRDTRAASPDPWAAGFSAPCVMLRFGWLWLLLFGLLGRFMSHGNLLLVQCKSVGHSLLLPQHPGLVITSCYRHLWHLQAQTQNARYTAL